MFPSRSPDGGRSSRDGAGIADGAGVADELSRAGGAESHGAAACGGAGTEFQVLHRPLLSSSLLPFPLPLPLSLSRTEQSRADGRPRAARTDLRGAVACAAAAAGFEVRRRPLLSSSLLPFPLLSRSLRRDGDWELWQEV